MAPSRDPPPRRHLLYTPTHRDATRCLKDRFAEALWVETETDRQAILCLVEHTVTPVISRRHDELLTHSSSRERISVLHLTKSKATSFVVRLLERIASSATRNHLHTLLLPDGVSYGAGPNLAYLLGAALRCQAIHRRDSDVYLDRERGGAYPIELELRAMDEHLGFISPAPEGSEQFAPTQTVSAVGTNTFGSATIDRRDLLDSGINHLVAYQSLGRPGVAVDRVHAEAFNSLVEEPERRYTDDFFAIDNSGRIEMESCCLSWITRLVPEMPTDILGCDYMPLNVAKQTGHVALYHSRKMRHEYDSDRAGSPPSLAYSIRDLQYMQIGRLCSYHNPRIRKDPNRFMLNQQFDSAAYAGSFREACNEAESELARVRLEAGDVYRSAAEAAPEEIGVRLRRIATEIDRLGEQIDLAVIKAVRDFADLVEAWPALIAEAARHRDFVESLLLA